MLKSCYIIAQTFNQQGYLLMNLDWYEGTRARLVTASEIVIEQKYLIR